MLKIDQLVSGYGTVQILNGANMKVDNQSIVALLGGNGTGKSTILKATSGLIRAWKGSIEFDGEQIHNLPPHEIVGRGLVQVTQGKDVFPSMSVTENLRLGGHTNSKDIPENIERVLDLFPILKERSKGEAGYLSGGEQQMLAIGRALMSNPNYLLLDEPSLGLAPKLVFQIDDFFVKLVPRDSLMYDCVVKLFPRDAQMDDFGGIRRRPHAGTTHCPHGRLAGQSRSDGGRRKGRSRRARSTTRRRPR